MASLFCMASLCKGQQPPAPVGLSLDPAALEAGYKLETAQDGVTRCGVIVPPPVPAKTGGNLVETVSADAYRGKSIRLSAWLRVQSASLEDSAQLWVTVNRPNGGAQAIGFFDNQSDKPVNSAEWTRSEATLSINPDAETVSFGVLSAGRGTVWVKDLSLLVINGLASRSSPGLGQEVPVNLKFGEGATGATPPGWKVLPDAETAPAPYKAQNSARGCHRGPPCAVLISPNTVPPQTYGTLMQNFKAAGYRGRTVRLRASVRLQPGGREDHVRLWLRTGRAFEIADASNLFEHMDYREFRNTDWTPGEIITRIDENIEDIGIGVMLMGKGRVFIDEVSFTVITEPATSPATGLRLTNPLLADAPPNITSAFLPPSIPTPLAPLAGALPETNWPSLPRPSVDEQLAAVNGASRRALRYIVDLPNFLCNLLIDRSENRNDGGWRDKDVLNVQLGFSERTEHYKLTSVNGRPTSLTYRAVGGAISEGDFGSVMAEIFLPHSAQFHWDHWTSLRSHVAHVFRYQIAAKKSEYELVFGDKKGKPVTTITAHHGYVYIEKDTNNILRIEQIAAPPAGFPLRYAVNVIDYDWNEVAGQKYLLPLRAEITMGSASLRSFNVVQFRDYRKFAAESQITFDAPQ
jgi:hypothetical protein